MSHNPVILDPETYERVIADAVARNPTLPQGATEASEAASAEHAEAHRGAEEAAAGLHAHLNAQGQEPGPAPLHGGQGDDAPPERPGSPLRDVQPVEVLSYARPSCKLCHGTGAFWVTRIDQKAKRASRTPQTCNCAVRRFLRVRKAEVVQQMEGGLIRLRWKATA